MAHSFRLLQSASAALRLDAATAFVGQLSPIQPVTIVSASRGAADDFARRIAIARGATLGIGRFSLTQLAARVAVNTLAGRGVAPTSHLGAEAVAARAAFDAASAARLQYLTHVAQTPGFPRALARTVSDLRLAGLAAVAVASAGPAGADLAALLQQIEQELDAGGIADRARLFAAATAAVPVDGAMSAALVLLDVAITSPAEAAFAQALARASQQVLAVCPVHDGEACRVLQDAGGVLELREEYGGGDLASLRRHLFAEAAPPRRELDGSLQLFSAPGEGREAIEIARRVLEEARRGVPFDDMAILVRSPQHYHGLLEHALARARIPAWFDRGTRRPHPAGRAFLALIACATEGLSARRFAEYLSLGQLPAANTEDTGWYAAADDILAPVAPDATAAEIDEEQAWDEAAGDETTPRVIGTLRAPRQWERLLVEAAVINGGADRWERRLDGLAREFRVRHDEALRQDPESTRAAAITRDLEHLGHLRAFAIPLVRELAEWTGPVVWGVWLSRLEQLAPRVLRVPAYVLRVLADLRPMSAVGPVSLEEVRSVLADRLRLVDAEPPRRRYGRLFVGSPAQARGRAFRVVFVPGLAERMFPQKSSQDPLLLDVPRERLDAALPTRTRRAQAERLLLHLAAGAATERLYVSYPRLEVAEGRARVPSFYALDLVRGATGRIPDPDALEAGAALAGGSTLAWPAPADAMRAIDDQEHDLAVLGRLLAAEDPAAVRGRAQYLLRLNPALRRSVTERWARAERKWSQFDGLTRVTPAIADALASQRLGVRQYSLSALQRFAACPYQFLLGATYRLEPAEQPVPLQRLDPLTRGSIVHAMQAAFFRKAKDQGLLPVVPGTLTPLLDILEDAIARVAAAYGDDLAPAIPRVWLEEIALIARDLRGWLTRLADDGGEWTPRHFELAFGLRIDEQRDPASSPDAVTIDNRFTLRGSVDLVEEHGATGVLRVTDHKPGRDRTKDGLTIGSGEVLQPVLYAMVVEQMTGRDVFEARLSFCTSAGGFRVRTVPLSATARRAGVEALEIIDRAVQLGFLPPAPREDACTWCSFRPVCGPSEASRIDRKPQDRLADLHELRSRP
jgi:CRISPR/Cas system-associated exonuclease Cas4 (RecB family)